MRRAVPISLVVAFVVAALTVPAAAPGIIGGSSAERVPPAMAALYLDSEFLCGGTLVGPRAVLTADHCVKGLEPPRLAVALGHRDPASVAKRSRRAVHSIRRARRGDVAIVVLKQGTGARPARVVGRRQTGLWAPGAEARVIGYGATWLLGEGGVGLRVMSVPLRSDRDCARNLVGYDDALEICAGDDLGRRDACSGDSGGPLLVRDRRGRELVAGVVSRGLACAVPAQYGIYARVGGPVIRGWISRTLSRVGKRN